MSDAFISHIQSIIDLELVYRVNWLRAKARYNRWVKEEELIRHEMLWTVLYHRHEGKSWEGHADSSSEEGKKAYAHQKVLLWASLEREASIAFKGLMVDEN